MKKLKRIILLTTITFSTVLMLIVSVPKTQAKVVENGGITRYPFITGFLAYGTPRQSYRYFTFIKQQFIIQGLPGEPDILRTEYISWNSSYLYGWENYGTTRLWQYSELGVDGHIEFNVNNLDFDFDPYLEISYWRSDFTQHRVRVDGVYNETEDFFNLSSSIISDSTEYTHIDMKIIIDEYVVEEIEPEHNFTSLNFNQTKLRMNAGNDLDYHIASFRNVPLAPAPGYTTLYRDFSTIIDTLSEEETKYIYFDNEEYDYQLFWTGNLDNPHVTPLDIIDSNIREDGYIKLTDKGITVYQKELIDNNYIYNNKGFIPKTELINVYLGRRLDSDLWDEGFNEGYGTGKQEGRDEGFDTGYNEGVRDTENDFINNEREAYDRGVRDGANQMNKIGLEKWLVPAIVVILFLGGFIGFLQIRRRAD